MIHSEMMGAWVHLLVLQSQQPPSGREDLQWTILITFLVERAFSLYREHRNRKWDMQDRELARARQVRQVEEVKQEVIETKGTLQDGVKARVEEVANMVRRFDDLPTAVAQQPTILSEEAVEKVAEKVADKVINGTRK